ncbi:MAG: SusC/RagA family TonB-linked outer membrane protein, partial [Chitinophagaceae bacterium]|nr:SusC/RagA family TonB-linked outer membrane protein [Chitinophagaceae bacterium]
MLIKKSFLRSMFFFLALLQGFLSFSQGRQVTGKVADDQGKGLPGATVAVKGASVSVAADTDGRFSITVPASATALVVTAVGYAEQEVQLNGRTTVDITMQTDARSLGDVVVVGYGTVRKKDATGAVSSISAKDFSQGVISNPLQQIQGKVAGLTITQAGGDPNANLIIRLRGQTSLSGGQTPLVVLDGIPLDDPNQISSIPPGDVASYDVLKDVSATAIYGSRGANGVIIINTKKGQAGRSRVEYNGYVSADKLAKDFDLLTANEWRAIVPTVPGITPATIAALDKGANTDWLGAITRTGITHSHNLAVSGGTGSFNYRASVNYMDQEGIVVNSGKEQLGLRFTAQQKALNNKLDLQVSLFNNQNLRKYTDYAIFAYVNTTPPTYPVYNPDGSYFAYYDFEQQNPVAQQMMQTNQGRENLTQLMGRADYELISGLKVGVLGSISRY